MAGKKRRRASLETRYFVGLGMGSAAEKRRVEADRKAFPEEYRRSSMAEGPILNPAPSGDYRVPPFALYKERWSEDPSNRMRWESHAHSTPSHHVGPCDESCRRGEHAHPHRPPYRRRA